MYINSAFKKSIAETYGEIFAEIFPFEDVMSNEKRLL
jgi:hypothetical protein